MRSIDVSKNQPLTSPAAPGAVPMLQWLRIVDLVVDDGYQRELKKDGWARVRRIAEHFRWSRFSTVLVSPVEGGKFAVIDGQHRTHAAALRGIESVPCQVTQMSREEQAASFAAVNGLVTKVTPWNILKAAIVAGERWAVEAADACAEAGCRLMTANGSADAKLPGEIYSIGLVRKAIAGGQRAALVYALSGIRNAPLKFSGKYQSYGVDALKPLLLAVVERPRLVKADKDLGAFLGSFDVWKAIDAAGETAKARRRAGAIGVSRHDLAAAAIGAAMDEFFGDDESEQSSLGRAEIGSPPLSASSHDLREETAVKDAPEARREAVASLTADSSRDTAALEMGSRSETLQSLGSFSPARSNLGRPRPAPEPATPPSREEHAPARGLSSERFRLRSLDGQHLNKNERTLTRMPSFFWRGTTDEIASLKRRKPEWRDLKPELITT